MNNRELKSFKISIGFTVVLAMETVNIEFTVILAMAIVKMRPR